MMSTACKMRLARTTFKFSYILFYSSQPEYACNQSVSKVVNVAIIGAPNSGKSTLINNIVGRKICAASNKVHTTTKLIRAMSYQNNTQIIFLDTPGIITAKEERKYNLPESMMKECEKSLRCANVIGVIHDISNKWTKDYIHRDVLKMLEVAEDIPSFLIINKIDSLKSKKQLLSIIRNLTNGVIAGKPMLGVVKDNKLTKGYSKFSDVFLVSALNGDGVKEIKDYLVSNAKPGNLLYPSTQWTDQTPQTLIEEAVRATFLDFLPQEIPYSLTVNLERHDENEKEITTSVAVECPNERLARLISGAGGGRLQQMKSSVRLDLIDLFKKPVVIDLRLKIKRDSLTEI